MIEFTDSAAKKVYTLIADEGDLALCLRVYIVGGGCSGFQYGFTFDDQVAEDDQVVSKQVHAGVVGLTQSGKESATDHQGVDQSGDESGNEGDDEGSDAGQTAVKLLIDAISYPYLSGATIDYREDVQGAQFVIKNPNAKTTCGCGSSFSV